MSGVQTDHSSASFVAQPASSQYAHKTEGGTSQKAERSTSTVGSRSVTHGGTSPQDESVSKLAKQAFHQYEVFTDPHEHVTYIVHKDADIQDPALKAEIDKVKSLRQNEMGETSQVDKKALKAKYDEVTEGMIVKDGKLMKPYLEKGVEKLYDTGMTPMRLVALLAQSMKTNTSASSVIRMVGTAGQKQDVISVLEGRTTHLVHVGEFVAKGGAGTVYKAWDIGGKQIAIIKESHSTNLEEIVSHRSATDVEAAAVRTINPHGNHAGLQKAPYLVFRIVGTSKENQRAGFVTYKYDGDLSGVLAKNGNPHHVDFSTKQILMAVHQLFAGGAELGRKGVADMDIKPANVFIKKEEDGSYTMDISDFDGARELTDSYFASSEFAENPVPNSSSDSLGQNNFMWLKKTGTAIAEKHERLNELKGQDKLSSAEKKEMKSLEKDVKILQDKYRELAKDAHAWSVGHIVMQLLIGDVKLDSDYSQQDFKQITDAIRNDASLTPAEKDAKLQLAIIMNRAMKPAPPPPKGELTADTQFPSIGISMQDLWESVHGILIEYRKATG